MLMLPTRASAVFATTLNVTFAPPVPCDGDAPTIQSTLLFAVHWHPGVAVSAKVTSAGAAPTSRLAGSIANLQGAGACTTSSDSFDTVTCARREVPLGFGCTE